MKYYTCEHCGKPRSRHTKRFCSNLCKMAVIRGKGGQHPSLTEEQIGEIIFRRSELKEPYKIIARAVSCSPFQASYYSRKAGIFGSKRFKYYQNLKAKHTLAAEIAAAKAEAATCPPFKVGPLGEW